MRLIGGGGISERGVGEHFFTDLEYTVVKRDDVAGVEASVPADDAAEGAGANVADVYARTCWCNPNCIRALTFVLSGAVDFRLLPRLGESATGLRRLGGVAGVVGQDDLVALNIDTVLAEVNDVGEFRDSHELADDLTAGPRRERSHGSVCSSRRCLSRLQTVNWGGLAMRAAMNWVARVSKADQ